MLKESPKMPKRKAKSSRGRGLSREYGHKHLAQVVQGKKTTQPMSVRPSIMMKRKNKTEGETVIFGIGPRKGDDSKSPKDARKPCALSRHQDKAKATAMVRK